MKRGMDPSERLERALCRVLERPLLPYEKVIRACEKLSDELLGVLDGDHMGWIEKVGLDSLVGRGQIGDSRTVPGQMLDSPIGVEGLRLAAHKISRGVLTDRVKRELGEDPAGERRRFPLGVLLHLGAGNVDGLGAYSVIEGLLAGNVNLLKPSGTDRASAFLLKELVRLEPELAPYIHIFPISSDRQATIKRLAEMADGVVVWGSDETVRQMRAMVGPDKKLIEWGHRFSFAYCTEQGLKDREKVRELALHIIRTQQRFCSSCQAVFVDTDRKGAKEEAARMLRKEICRLQEELGWDVGQIAQMTLREHMAELEEASAVGCSGTHPWAGGCPVCCLPRHRAVWTLRRLPLSLQTAALLCQEDEWEELSYLLLKAGAVGVKRPGQMEEQGYGSPADREGEHTGEAAGERAGGPAHDGEYPLLRYTKVVER